DLIDVVTRRKRRTKVEKRLHWQLLSLLGNDLKDRWVFIIFKVPERRRDAQKQQTFRAQIGVKSYRR
ncbi:MAG TPA: hypothetical protein VHP35_04590, partial [Terriglobia bacterium]|nr:hypothetical protein [Terriglobia bacterium]